MSNPSSKLSTQACPTLRGQGQLAASASILTAADCPSRKEKAPGQSHGRQRGSWQERCLQLRAQGLSLRLAGSWGAERCRYTPPAGSQTALRSSNTPGWRAGPCCQRCSPALTSLLLPTPWKGWKLLRSPLRQAKRCLGAQQKAIGAEFSSTLRRRSEAIV